MRYLSVTEIAKKWNISERSVRNYCAQGRVQGAFLTGKTWNIPENVEKPERSNKRKEHPLTLLDILQEQLQQKLVLIMVSLLLQILLMTMAMFLRTEGLSFRTMEKLFSIMRGCRKPILVHDTRAVGKTALLLQQAHYLQLASEFSFVDIIFRCEDDCFLR